MTKPPTELNSPMELIPIKFYQKNKDILFNTLNK